MIGLSECCPRRGLWREEFWSADTNWNRSHSWKLCGNDRGVGADVKWKIMTGRYIDRFELNVRLAWQSWRSLHVLKCFLNLRKSFLCSGICFFNIFLSLADSHRCDSAAFKTLCVPSVPTIIPVPKQLRPQISQILFLSSSNSVHSKWRESSLSVV